MSTLLRCSRGHSWNWADYVDGAEPPDGPIPCPLCGALSSTAIESVIAISNAIVRATSDTPGLPSTTSLSIAGYEILSQLGRGGMGVVFKARQVSTDRIVALKLPDRLDLETRVRFATEAKAAARVSHPNVVQIYEVGEQDDRPYIALEYCPGGALSDCLEGKPLASKPAAALVEVLAGAVGAAHSAGVIHRDLKPANILLGRSLDAEAGNDRDAHSRVHSDPLTFHPKVADFGLARRIDCDVGQTQSGMMLGTPDYMAPEQTTGEIHGIGPPSDVYALGSLLYELLTGHPPFRGTNLIDTIEQVRHREPIPPMRLQPSVPRDLNTICLKCLHKEPARRYASAGELAQDLNRFLNGLPVLARPVSIFERSVKRIRRNPIVAALAAGLCVVLLGAAVYGVWYHVRLQAQRDRARYHFQMSVRSIEEMLTEVAEEDLAPEPRAELKRRALLEKALAFYEELLQVESDDPDLAWHAARAARRVGDIQRMLGRFEESLSAYERALKRLEPLAKSPPPETDPRREIADCHNFIGEVYRTRGEKALAETSYRRALDMQQALFDQNPENVGYRQDLARTRYNLGIVIRQLGRPDDAIAQFTQALSLLDGDSSNDAWTRRHRARVYLNLAPAYRLLGRFPEAEEACNRAVVLLDALATENPERGEFRLELSSALINLGTVRFSAREPVRARPPLDRARTLLESLAHDFPATPGYRAELARVCNTLAAVAFQTGDADAAATHSARAVELWSELVAASPSTAEYHGELGLALGNLGRAKYQAVPADARQHLTRGISELLKGLQSNPAEPAFRSSLRQQTRDVAGLLVRAEDHDAAQRLARDLASGLPGKADGTHRAVSFIAACVEPLRTRPDSASIIEAYVALAAKFVREAGPNDWSALRNDPECKWIVSKSPLSDEVGLRK